jgi:hypothetical protein
VGRCSIDKAQAKRDVNQGALEVARLPDLNLTINFVVDIKRFTVFSPLSICDLDFLSTLINYNHLSYINNEVPHHGEPRGSQLAGGSVLWHHSRDTRRSTFTFTFISISPLLIHLNLLLRQRIISSPATGPSKTPPHNTTHPKKVGQTLKVGS